MAGRKVVMGEGELHRLLEWVILNPRCGLLQYDQMLRAACSLLRRGDVLAAWLRSADDARLVAEQLTDQIDQDAKAIGADRWPGQAVSVAETEPRAGLYQPPGVIRWCFWLETTPPTTTRT